jgi:hypothetical protein
MNKMDPVEVFKAMPRWLRKIAYGGATALALYAAVSITDSLIDAGTRPRSDKGLKMGYRTLANKLNYDYEETFSTRNGKVVYTSSPSANALLKETILLYETKKEMSAEQIFDLYVAIDSDGNVTITDEEARLYRNALKQEYGQPQEDKKPQNKTVSVKQFH